MATLAALRNEIDTWLASTAWPYIVQRQTLYFQTHGRFAQIRRTHLLEPDGTSNGSTAPDTLEDHPSDQAETVLDVLPAIAGVSIRAKLVIDTWDGPNGKGFVARLFAKHQGTIYSRSQGARWDEEQEQVVKDAYGTDDWHVVTLPE